ncbi:MAG: iron-sulfur cluster assembly accessory protein [Kangiellaceae bacterium]|jgi:iron-sulfur cluster assembly accessory protein|nr:iron-sulfur cluster assembly accessory protein [Kangiellaceae bacterium]
MTVASFSIDDMTITMTDKAIAHFNRQLAKRDETCVRFSVKESGCSGYMYVMDFVDNGDLGDREFQFGDVSVFVSKDALPIMQGSEIDLVTEGVNSNIQFNNPNAKAMCGCGESFTL